MTDRILSTVGGAKRKRVKPSTGDALANGVQIHAKSLCGGKNTVNLAR